MGKNLKGKELGSGIHQRKDGRYSARFTDMFGKRHEKYFQTVPEARKWLANAKYEKNNNSIIVVPDLTVDEWFDFWIENIVGDLAVNTLRNYRERYEHNVKHILGHMPIVNVRPLHCKQVFTAMDSDYSGSTMRQTYIMMGTMFKAAKMNDIITKHPLETVRFSKPVRAVDDIKFLTRDEQAAFLQTAQRSHNHDQYALVLETGLRVGEIVGLTWDAIDFEKRTLTVNKTLEYRHSLKVWRAGPPKTQESYRTIPLTDNAYEILKRIWDNRDGRKEAPLLSTTLEYMDRKTGTVKKFVMRDLVFINWRTGEPSKNSSYDSHLYKLCEQAGIQRFSMHALRHTYATRAIESGMQPKILQKLLGHRSIKTTMDRYVHVTNDSLKQAIQQFESNNIVI